MKYNITKSFKFYENPYYDDDVYGQDRIRAKYIVLHNIPLNYGEIDWNALIDVVSEQEYAYAVTSKDFCEVNNEGQTLH